MEKISPAFIGTDIDGESAHLKYKKESPTQKLKNISDGEKAYLKYQEESLLATLEKLNAGKEIIIIKTGKRFYLSHMATEKPLSLYVHNLKDAMEFRNFLEALDIKNQSCLQREKLYNKCLLERTKGNDVYSKEDMNSIFRPFYEPFLYQEALPEFLKGNKTPANAVKTIMDYMNSTMLPQ